MRSTTTESNDTLNIFESSIQRPIEGAIIALGQKKKKTERRRLRIKTRIRAKIIYKTVKYIKALVYLWIFITSSIAKRYVLVKYSSDIASGF